MLGLKWSAARIVGACLVAVVGLQSCADVSEPTSSTDAGLPGGLACPELAEEVLTYADAVAYFEQEGRPARLDENGDGIPCELDFSVREVQSVFGSTTTTAPSSTLAATTTTTQAGASTSLGGTTSTTLGPTSTTQATTTSTEATTTTAQGPIGQFAAFVGGTTPRPCSKWQNPPDPYFGLVNTDPTMTVGRIAVFCVVGFDVSDPIDVEVTLPDGSVVLFEAQYFADVESDTADNPLAGEPLTGNDDSGLQWLLRESYQLGTYQFIARQGALETSAEVDLVPATTARIEPFLENRSGFSDGSLRFALSGFGAGQSIQLGLYRDATDPFGEDGTDHEFDLVGVVEPVVADGSGSVVAVVEPDSSLPSGERHCLATPLIASPNCDNYRGGWFTP